MSLEQVIVTAPFYQSLGEVARSIGAEVCEWHADWTCGWTFNLDELRKLLTARTRVVVVKFPHNPTGFLPSPEFIRELSALSDRNGFGRKNLPEALARMDTCLLKTI